LSNSHVFFNDEHNHPENSRKCHVFVVAAPTWQDARFWMSWANVLKSGMGMWSRAYSLKSSPDASLADIVCGGSGGGGAG